jgi:AraC-like DNA-binding protein
LSTSEETEERHIVRTSQTALPRQELREFVRCYALREIDGSDVGLAQANMATVDQAIAFFLDGQTFLDSPDGQSRLASLVNVFGPVTPPCGGVHFGGHVLAFAIFFKPLALWQLFRIPPSILTNKVYDAVDLLGKEIQNLWSMLAESRTFQEQACSVEEYLLPFAINALARTYMMKTAQYMTRQRGVTRIGELAFHSGLSVRQYERRFAEEVGLTPKLFARVTRFGMALDKKRLAPDLSWTSVAHELGYFDQMHMVRDFQSLGGNAPGEVLKQSGDIAPWSLGSPMTIHDLSRPPQRDCSP